MRALGRHDAGDTGDAEHIALKDAPAVTTLDPAAIDAAEKSDTLEG